MSHTDGARVAAAMKRLQRFTASEMAAYLNLADEENARRWIRRFHDHGMCVPDGFGVRRGDRGTAPNAWRWQG